MTRTTRSLSAPLVSGDFLPAVWTQLNDYNIRNSDLLIALWLQSGRRLWLPVESYVRAAFADLDVEKQRMLGEKGQRRPLGCIVAPDASTRTLSAARWKWKPVDLRPYIPLKAHDQGDAGTCVAEAAAAAIQFQIKNSLELSVSAMAVGFLYNRCKQIDGIPGDSGTYLRTATDALRRFGICEEMHYEYDWFLAQRRKTGIEAGPEPSSTAFSNAAEYVLEKRMEFPLSIEEISRALAAGNPVELGLRLHMSFMNPVTAQTGEVPHPGPDDVDPVLGGHAMLCVGLREDGCAILQNSWGDDWGDDGCCYVKLQQLLRDGHRSGYVTTLKSARRTHHKRAAHRVRGLTFVAASSAILGLAISQRPDVQQAVALHAERGVESVRNTVDSTPILGARLTPAVAPASGCDTRTINGMVINRIQFKPGDAIHALSGGTCLKIIRHPALGNIIITADTRGNRLIYGGLGEITVSPGMKLRSGIKLGSMRAGANRAALYVVHRAGQAPVL